MFVFVGATSFFFLWGETTIGERRQGVTRFSARTRQGSILWKICLTRVEGFEHRSEQASMAMSRFEEAMLAAAAALVVMTLLFEISFILDIFINLAW